MAPTITPYLRDSSPGGVARSCFAWAQHCLRRTRGGPLVSRPPHTAETIDQLLDRYAREVVPTKAPRTQTENIRYIAALRQVFGDLAIADMKPQLVYRYVDKRSAKIAAHREMEVLSHAFTKAVEWGYIDRHPFKGEVRLQGEKPRDRYVEDWEVLECLALDSRRKKGSVLAIQAYIRIKLMTGMARSDLLRLQPCPALQRGWHPHSAPQDGRHHRQAHDL